MIRKLCLVGVPLLFRGSPSIQAVVFAMLAVFFGLLQASGSPYKMAMDNNLRLLTEQHIVVLASISGALLGEAEEGVWSLEARLLVYDVLLVISFYTIGGFLLD